MSSRERRPSRSAAGTAGSKEAKRQAKLAKKQKRKHKPKSHDERVPLWIYKEFQRISSTRKENLKQAKRHVRNAAREAKYWQKEINYIENRCKGIYRPSI